MVVFSLTCVLLVEQFCCEMILLESSVIKLHLFFLRAESHFGIRNRVGTEQEADRYKKERIASCSSQGTSLL